jgi:hypothetical protein
MKTWCDLWMFIHMFQSESSKSAPIVAALMLDQYDLPILI